jgi:hypothetical protein
LLCSLNGPLKSSSCRSEIQDDRHDKQLFNIGLDGKMNKVILRDYDPYKIWIFVLVENSRWLQPQNIT